MKFAFSAHRGLDGGGSRLDTTLGIGYHYQQDKHHE